MPPFSDIHSFSPQRFVCSESFAMPEKKSGECSQLSKFVN
jgi:hypothetical protein